MSNGTNGSVGASPDAFKIDNGGPTGVLLIHGLSGSPAEMRGLGGHLAKHGYTVSGPRVPGHGTKAEDMAPYSWRHWVAACGMALDELRQSCSDVFVAGLSNGALLALYLAATARPKVSGVISMSAPLYWRDWRMNASPVLKYAVRWHTKGPPEDIDPTARERLWHYPRIPTAPVAQMVALGRECRRLLPRLTVPLLVMQGRHDRTVHPSCPHFIHENAASRDKELVLWDNSAHVLTEDMDRFQVWDKALDFIAKRQK